MSSTRKVLLIGWDAADWKVIRPLLDAGKMPNLRRLVSNGVSAQIATLHPPLSPMLWTSIATGKRPFKHGVLGFSEPTPDGRGVQPVSNLSRKSKALWNILHQNDLQSVVIGWWPSHPAEPIHGVMVSDHYHRARGPLEKGWPLPAHTVHPPDLTAKLAGLRVHPDILTPQDVEPFIPLAREIDQDKDNRLAMLLRTLAECMSIHAAATWLIENQPWDFFAVYYDAIDHFSHGFMKYHPPRQPWITERDFELYSNVISMAYQFHDEMLGALLEKSGGETTVILMSDHGFHPDHLRPSSIPDIPAGPAVEHRDFGILAMRGPGIRTGDLLHAPSLLDIAPTILTLFGLPVGEDMDGRPITEAFKKPPQVSFVPSWEDIAAPDGRHPPHLRLNPVAAHEAMEQMIALGYIARPDNDRPVAVEKTVRELRYNLGEAYQDADRHLEAREIFSELCAADPKDQRFAVRRFVSAQALSKHAEMREIVEDLEARGAPAPMLDYLKAQVLIAEERILEALAALEKVTEDDLIRPDVFLQKADLYLRLGRFDDARNVCEKALAIDPDNAHAHLALCRIALHQEKFSEAAQSALDALQRTHHYPLAHVLLGRALEGMQEHERAADAFRAAISLNPNFPEAHQRLEQSLIIVTGLPRSGTSMLMQMLAAGGIPILTDGLREADEDNPRGYLEFEPVKKLLKDSIWLFQARGKAIKIVAPLLAALPRDLPCRVILSDRDLDEVLDSQERMLSRHDQPIAKRDVLKAEYARIITRVSAMLAERPNTALLVLEHRQVISDPLCAADKINQLLDGTLNVNKMAAAVDPSLIRVHPRSSAAKMPCATLKTDTPPHE